MLFQLLRTLLIKLSTDAGLDRLASLYRLERPSEGRLYRSQFRSRLACKYDLSDFVDLFPAEAQPQRVPRALRTRAREFVDRYAAVFSHGRNDQRLTRRVNVLLSVWIVTLAALFLVGALIWLYFVTSDRGRLSIVCGLIVALPICLVTFFEMKPNEILALTTA